MQNIFEIGVDVVDFENSKNIARCRTQSCVIPWSLRAIGIVLRPNARTTGSRHLGRFFRILRHFGRFDIFVTFPCHKCDICDTRPKVPTDTPNHHTYGPESIWNQFGTKNLKINPCDTFVSCPFQNIKFPGNGTCRGPRLPIFARHATGVASDRFPSNPGHFAPFWPI